MNSSSHEGRDSSLHTASTASSRSRTVPPIDTQVTSYVDILTTPSGKDWLEAYEFPTLQRDEKQHRRTLSQTSPKQTVSVRKTKSLKDSNRTKLRSPPPPPPPPQEEFSTLPLMNKKVGSNNKETGTINPRRTVSSSLSPKEVEYSNTLAEYQGYSRQSRHRSFTYSPPPPLPRSSSLKTAIPNTIPPVPPVPRHHVSTTLKPRTSSIQKKKSDSSYTSSRSNSAHEKRPVSPEYKLNLSQDLAQIEQDIKALEIQRQSFILSQNETKTVGRKRGKVSCFCN